ncbi:nucleotidyltransferase domain-containing protein [Paenarthrobacter sp. NPDC058040]|uniref:nucleotidyltransferase domain-containing protein n=1 Tax=unclassified Paenarthrobacter TaxID=2634190 RepID=UPI0036DF97DE
MGVLYVLARAEADFTAPGLNALLPEKGSLAGVRKALVRLVEQGIVVEKLAGRTHTYSLNQDHLLADYVKSMASAKELLSERTKQTVRAWEFRPIVVTIFGSAVRNDMRTDSDIDLFIALPDAVDELQAETRIADLAAGLSAWTGNDTRPLVYRESEVAPAPIFDSIVSEGQTIYGDGKWLKRKLRGAQAA